MKTTVEGGKKQLEETIDAILAGPNPNITFIVMLQKGYWVIIHN